MGQRMGTVYSPRNVTGHTNLIATVEKGDVGFVVAVICFNDPETSAIFCRWSPGVYGWVYAGTNKLEKIWSLERLGIGKPNALEKRHA